MFGCFSSCRVRFRGLDEGSLRAFILAASVGWKCGSLDREMCHLIMFGGERQCRWSVHESYITFVVLCLAFSLLCPSLSLPITLFTSSEAFGWLSEWCFAGSLGPDLACRGLSSYC